MGKKLSGYSFQDQTNFIRLLDLRGKLRYVGWDTLGLKNLDPLRGEVAQVLKEKYGVKDNGSQ